MAKVTLKYCICFLVEKLHRHVFDNIYDQEHRITAWDRIVIVFLFGFCAKLYPDYRRYLKKVNFHKYQRYTAYWQ